jgi:AraC-like DNA-binding protein
MWTTTEVCLLVAVAQLVVMAALLLRDHRRDPSALASVFFIAAIVDHLLLPVLVQRGAPALLVHLVAPLSVAVPVGFWILVKVHFDDDFRLCSRHALALGGFVALNYGCWLVGGTGDAWAIVPRVAALAVMVHALLHVYDGTRSDLVVPRLKLRYVVLIASGVYIFLEILAETVLGESFGTPHFGEQLHAVSTLMLVASMSFLCLRVRPEVLKPARAPAAEVVPIDPALEERLRRLMEGDEAFREEGLTILRLAERLGVHEHKVRQLINSRLGFKNFNAYLHHFRIREAQAVLADPARAHLGVAQIAYQVGYRSLGPFNKAFKEMTGLTPTEYRIARQEEANPRAQASAS